jgi:hypothetical protein
MGLECKRDTVQKVIEGVKRIKVYYLHVYGDNIKKPPNIVFKREKGEKKVKGI